MRKKKATDDSQQSLETREDSIKMDSITLLEGGSLPQDPAAVTAPTISDEEYKLLAELQVRQNTLKIEGFDLQQYIAQLKPQLASAEEALAARVTALTETNEQIVAKYNEFVVNRFEIPQGYGVKIDDASPHVVHFTPPAPAA